MNKLFSTPEFPEFPIKEFEAELEQEHTEFKSAIQKSLQKSLAQLKEQNPELMGAQIIKLNDIKISIKLKKKTSEILLEHDKQIQDIVTKDVYSQIEKALGRPITPAELTFPPLSIPLSEIKKVDQIRKDYELAVAKGYLNHNLTFINENIPEGQTTRPDIRISLYMPGRRGSRMLFSLSQMG